MRGRVQDAGAKRCIAALLADRQREHHRRSLAAVRQCSAVDAVLVPEGRFELSGIKISLPNNSMVLVYLFLV